MNELTRRDEQCLTALRDYLAGGGEATLHAAYEFGREALESGLGVLDLTAVLQRTLVQVDGDAAHAPHGMAPFLLECYSPYEMAHLGAREANEALRRINETREEDMKRLAHELHDEAGQMLAAVYLALDAVADDVAPTARERFETVRERLGDVERQLRRISHEMRPLVLDDLGLVPALRFLVEGVAQRSGIAVRVEGATGLRLPAAVETALYRSAQEALTNVARHARAGSATLRVDRCEGYVALTVTDDGVGFDARDIESNGGATGLGLGGIRARAASLGGTLEVRSRPGRGTELIVRIPTLNLDDAARPAG